MFKMGTHLRVGRAWRQVADPYCDDALRETFPSASASTGVDLLESVERQAAQGPGPARDFMEHVTSLPPENIRVSRAQILRAQTFFYTYSAPILAALMHFSLAGGFASARITRVLHSVSYLVPGKSGNSGEYSVTEATNDRTFKRLLETLQMVLDVMGGSAALAELEGLKTGSPTAAHALVPGEEGWRSTVRVRLLHGVARRRIMERLHHGRVKPGIPNYDFDADGYPINQEDLAATLASFSIAPLWCLSRQGYHASHSDREDFLALWKHAGFYLGIEPAILARHFNTVSTSEKFLASAVVHLLESPLIQPEGYKPTSSSLPPPTMPILRAISARPPFPSSLAYNCALTRFLIGDTLADHLGVPQTPTLQYVRLRIRLFLTKVPYLFGKIYRIRGWEARRIRLSREGLSRLVRWQMGLRRTAFRPRREDGDLAEGVKEAEAIVPNMVLGQAFMREYRFLIREMVGVIAGTAVLFVVAGWKLLRWVRECKLSYLCHFMSTIPKTQKAVVCTGPNQPWAVLADHPVPHPGPYEVLIKVIAVGLCGGDGVLRSGAMPGLHYPVIAGHEVVGRVVALGHVAIPLARALGLRPIVVSRTEEKRQAALELGAEAFITSTAQLSPESDPLVEEIIRIVDGPFGGPGAGPQGVHVVLQTAPEEETLKRVTGALAMDSEVVLLGEPESMRIDLPLMPFLVKRASVRGWTAGIPTDAYDTLRFCVQTGVRCTVQTTTLDKAEDAYTNMGAARFRTVVVLDPEETRKESA
ncbi:hypothetical protein FRC06_006699 [Ceratobasidium sp. 370]|nr:hypothetical protein FRC06_006699 [Ceratobasidium sp. 370]